MLAKLLDKVRGPSLLEKAAEKRIDEYTYQSYFNKYVDKIIPGCKTIKYKSTAQNRTDSWVMIAGKEAPVEVKLRKFDCSALKQLQRYMTAFNSEIGVAVGERLTVGLPENIYFVSNR